MYQNGRIECFSLARLAGAILKPIIEFFKIIETTFNVPITNLISVRDGLAKIQ